VKLVSTINVINNYFDFVKVVRQFLVVSEGTSLHYPLSFPLPSFPSPSSFFGADRRSHNVRSYVLIVSAMEK
jgi:hypothetical protein